MLSYVLVLELTCYVIVFASLLLAPCVKSSASPCAGLRASLRAGLHASLHHHIFQTPDSDCS